MAQTAVEWYAKQNNNLIISYIEGSLTAEELYVKMLNILDEAKQMEKQQLEEAYRTSIKDSIDAKQ